MILTLLFILGFQTETSLSDIPTDDRGIIMNPYDITQPEHDFWIFEVCQRIQKAYRENPATNKFPGVQVSGSKVIVDPNIQVEMLALTDAMLIFREHLGITHVDPAMRNYQRQKLLDRGMSDRTITQFFNDLAEPEMDVNAFIDHRFRAEKIAVWYGTLNKVEAIQSSNLTAKKKASKKNHIIGLAVDEVLEKAFEIERSYADAILNLLADDRDKKIIAHYALEIIANFNQVVYAVAYKDGDIKNHSAWLKGAKSNLKAYAKEHNLSNEEVQK